MKIFNNIVILIILWISGFICPDYSFSKTNHPKSITFSWGHHILNADDPFKQNGYRFVVGSELSTKVKATMPMYKLAYSQPFYHDNIYMRFEMNAGGSSHPADVPFSYRTHHNFLNLEAGPLLLMRATDVTAFRFGGGIGLYKEWISFTNTDPNYIVPSFPNVDKSIHFGGWFDMGVEFGPRDKMRIELFFKYNRTTGQLSDNTKTFGVGLIWPFGKLK